MRFAKKLGQGAEEDNHSLSPYRNSIAQDHSKEKEESKSKQIQKNGVEP